MKKTMMKMKKAMLVLLITLIAFANTALPVAAAAKIPTSKKNSYASSGYVQPGLLYISRFRYNSWFFKTRTMTLKQSKGKAIYEKANKRLTTVAAYAKLRVTIVEGGDKGKIVYQGIWNDGSMKYKCKTNKNYTVYIEYLGIAKGDVLFGPLYSKNAWSVKPRWQRK